MSQSSKSDKDGKAAAQSPAADPPALTSRTSSMKRTTSANSSGKNLNAQRPGSSHRRPAQSPKRDEKSGSRRGFNTSPTARQAGGGGTSPAANRSPSSGATAGEGPQHGRRAGEGGVSIKEPAGMRGAGETRATNDWFSAATTKPKEKVQDQALAANVATVQDGVDAQALREHMEKAKAQKEKLANETADPPKGYQPPLPNLGDLNINSSWDKLLQSIHQEFDMSCLMSCLARELDEDVAWNPDMLLVQLTSELLDAAELRDDAAAMTVRASEDVGFIVGGEGGARERRRSRNAAGGSPKAGEGQAPAAKAASPKKAPAAANPTKAVSPKKS